MKILLILTLAFSHVLSQSWEPVSDSNGHLYEFWCDQYRSDIIYAFGYNPNHTIATHDGGETWSVLPFGGRRTYSIINHPSDSNVVYAASERIYKSNDHGESWFAIAAGVNEENFTIQGLAILPDTPDTMMIIGSSQTLPELYLTTNNCIDWSSISTYPLSFSGFGRAVYSNPMEPGTFYTGDNGSFSSTSDLGSTWTIFGGIDLFCTSFTFHPSHPQKVFVHSFVEPWNPVDGNWRKSTDGGQSWQILHNDYYSYSQYLDFDKNNPDLMYLGTPEGVLFSSDEFQSVEFLNNQGLGDFEIIHPRVSASNEIYGLCNGRIYRYSNPSSIEDNLCTPLYADLTISPNPSNGAIRIEFQGTPGQLVTATIYNLRGDVVLTWRVRLSSRTGTIYWNSSSVPSISSGVYLVQIGERQNAIRQKFTVIN